MGAPLAARIAAVLYLVLLPLIVLPGFHAEFAASKLLVLLVAGAPLWILGMAAFRGGPDPLDRLLPLVPGVVLLATAVAFLRHGEAGLERALFAWPLGLAVLLHVRAGTLLRASPGLLGAAHATALLFVLAAGALKRRTGVPDFLPDRGDVGWTATIGNSGELAEWAAPLAASLLLLPARGAAATVLATAGVAAGALLVLLSDSRAGILALGLGAAAAGVVALRRSRGRGPGRRAVLLGLAACALAGPILLLPGLRARLGTLLDPAHATHIVRAEVWAATLDLVAAEPWLGCGPGGFEAAFERHRRRREWDISGFESRVDTPHQEGLGLLAGIGIPGAVLVLALLLRLLLAAIPPRRGPATLPPGALLAALAATLAVALVRSPAHHPAGLLGPASLLGALLPPAQGGGLARIGRRLSDLFVLAVCVLLVFELRDDRRVRTARDGLAAAQHQAQAGDPRRAREALRSASEAVVALARDPAAGPAGLSASRAQRTYLVASELDRLRRELVARHLGPGEVPFPDPDASLRLQARVLHLLPDHTDAHRRRALLAIGEAGPFETASERTRVEQARSELVARVQRGPGAPGLRLPLARLHLLLGEIQDARTRLLEEARATQGSDELLAWLGISALRLGTGSGGLGAYIDPAAEPEALQAPNSAEDAREASRPAEAARLWLLRLGVAPRDQEALLGLSQAGFAALDDAELRQGAERAAARARLLFAVEARELGDAALAARQAHLARSKDPDLLDAWWILAECAARSGDASGAREALSELRARGVSRADLLARARAWGAPLQDALAEIP
jgi:O-antigen ligase